MEFSYAYTKLRKDFGKECQFLGEGPKLLQELRPDPLLSQNYIVKSSVCKSVQVGCTFSENNVNTPIKNHSDRGMSHIEGGWPKEIDTNDEEAVVRFRKKVERLDNYVAVMRKLTKPMEHAILQNNAINIYQKYFESDLTVEHKTNETCRIETNFKDPNKCSRPVTYCSWSPDGDELSIAYCHTGYQNTFTGCSESYIWNLERPRAPDMALQGDSPILSLEYNTRDPQWLVAGMYNGQISHFDTRRGSRPVSVSPVELSHRDPVHTVLWINSKSGAEFFSTSNDGVVLWWDCRHLEQPIDSIILDVTKADKPSMTRAWPVSCLEYEPSIPAKYMVGTETGYVICGNRKGLNHQEKLPVVQKCHVGPVFSIHRNQAFPKNFLVVGTWSAKIWSEDCRESSIIWTKNYVKGLTAGQWSPGRVSVFFLTRADGILDVWDILIDQKNPALSMRICEQPLTTLRVKEDGSTLVVGNAAGSTYVVHFPPTMAETMKNERAYLSGLFDRESHREKLLEGRNREIKLRLKETTLAKEADTGVHQKTELEIQTEQYKESLESDYLTEIENALRALEQKRVGLKLAQKAVAEQKEEEDEEEEEEEEEEGDDEEQ